MDNNEDLYGELKIYCYVIRIPVHASQAHKQQAKRAILQTIPCYYSERKETLARFKQANRNLDNADIWAEFRHWSLVD